MPKIKMPGFATGGAVGGSGGASIVEGGGEVVTLNLNFAGGASTLYGEKQQVRSLIAALQNADKGL